MKIVKTPEHEDMGHTHHEMAEEKPAVSDAEPMDQRDHAVGHKQGAKAAEPLKPEHDHSPDPHKDHGTMPKKAH
jgi:hypothetical protein